MYYVQSYPINQPKAVIEESMLKNKYENAEIFLRDLTRTDLDDFLTWASDPEVAQYMTWEPYTDKEDALNFLIDIVETHPFFKAIIFEGKVVGSLTLTLGKGNAACRAELGYVIAKQYWGKGIATAAVIRAIRSGFDEFKINRIEAFVAPENIPSQRVLQKAGMHFEGLLKNYMIFKGQIQDRFLFSIAEQ